MPKKRTSPKRINFNKNSKECKGWVNAHFLLNLMEGESENDADKTYRTAKTILHTLKYISFKQFKESIYRQFDTFLEKDYSYTRKYTLIIDKGKSSEWISNILKKYLDNLNIAIMDGDDKRIKLPGNYIRIDDAIYSGKQMCDYVRQFSVHDEHSKLFVVCPYQTHFGYNKIKNCIKETNANVVLYKPIVFIETFEELVEKHPASFDPDFLINLENMYPNNNVTNLPNIFFQHKVPDQFSGISSFLRYGLITNIRGRIVYINVNDTLEMPSFQCVPYIIPPYKKSIDYDLISKGKPVEYKKEMDKLYDLIDQNQELFTFGKHKRRSRKRR